MARVTVDRLIKDVAAARPDASDFPGMTFLATDTGAVYVSDGTSWLASSLGSGAQATDIDLAAWSFPPWACFAQSATTGGRIYYSAVRLDAATAVTNVVVGVQTAGATLTADECWLALYDSAGTRLGLSESQDTALEATGRIEAAVFGSATTLQAGVYWVAILTNGSTQPTIYRGSNATGIFNGSTLPAAFGLSASGSQTEMPATVDWSTDTTAGGTPYWVGLS